MTIHSRDPSYLGYMHLGYYRLGVTTSRWDHLIESNAEDVTRRIYALGDPDSTTGIRTADYSNTETVRMVFIEVGGRVPGFASGVVMLQDALGLTLNRFVTKDQVLRRGVFFEAAQVEDHYDSNGSFAFRAVHLHRLGLWREG